MKKRRTIPEGIPLYEEVEAYLRWASTRLQPSTIRTKRYTYAYFYQETGIRSLAELTNEVMDDWLTLKKKHGAGPVTLNRYISNTRALISWHREMGTKVDIPIKLPLLRSYRETRPEPLFYRKKAVEKVIKNTHDPMTKLILAIGFDTGARAFELCRLRLDYFQGCKLDFPAKGGVIRHTYISKRARKWLDDYLSQNGIVDFLWPGNDHGHIGYLKLYHLTKKAFAAQGHPEFHPHALRHSYIADLEFAGASTEEIMVLSGHRTYTAVQKYKHRIHQDAYQKELRKKYHKD